MKIKVIKRDGRVKGFDGTRIKNAISKAMLQTDLGLDEQLVETINNNIIKKIHTNISVEEIQDLVEDELMESNRKDVAKEYIRYRHLRSDYRNKEEGLDKKVNELRDLNEDVANENANKDSKVFNTQRDLLAGITAKDYALRNLLPKDIAEAHLKGEIHFHDLDYSPFFKMFNCMLIDFKGMLEKGTCIGNADIESPNTIEVATALISQITANVSSNIYGGTTFNRADEVLEPYAKGSYEHHLEIAKEFITDKNKQLEYAKKMTKKSIYKAMKSLEYEINTLYNSNGQTPFFTLNFGLGTSWFCREIQKAILNVRLEGLGKEHKTAVFPKLIFTLKRGLNLNSNDPNYDIKQLALKCTTKRMYPDILSYDKIVEVTGDFKCSMGCRSFLSPYINQNGQTETDGRNNLGVISLNLPRIALESHKSKEQFWKILKQRLELCKKGLLYRVHVLDDVQAKNAPILYMHGATGYRLKADDYVADIFKNGRASVSLGYIGLHEVATIFYGIDWQDNKEAEQFTLDIMKYLKDSTEQWKEETGYGFSIYSTPSENMCNRFCKLDKNVFGNVKYVTDKGYYTNSFHYDVNKTISPFEKIDFEAKYEQYSNGGFIHYCEFPSLINNPNGLEAVWDYAYDKIGYFGTNTPIDKCYECGYEGEFKATEQGFECPNCENNDPTTTSCIRRLCGYLGNVIQRNPNKGKLKEMMLRKKHI